MQEEPRIVKRYSEAFKIKVAEEIESGKMRINQANRFYRIKGGDTVRRWKNNYGKTNT